MSYDKLRYYAARRGILLGPKHFLNNYVGMGYNIYIGWRIYQVETLSQAYQIIKKYEKIER